MKIFVCTNCGMRLIEYAEQRAQYEGCPGCEEYNCFELKADVESEDEDEK